MRQTKAHPILFVLLLATACGGPPAEFGEVRRLPKDRRPTVWDASPRERLGVAEMGAPQNEQSRFVATTPAGWVERPPEPSRFKDLIWALPEAPTAECWLTAGVGGGVAGNMVRWYGQFGLPVGDVEQLPEVPFAGGTGRLLELAGSYDGKPDTAMLLAFTNNGARVTSLKFVGPNEVVEQNREKFLALAASLRQEQGAGGDRSQGSGQGAGDGGAGPVDPHGANPHGASPVGAGDPATEPFTATVPAGWTRNPQSTRPLHHTFGTAGEVYVSQLSGTIRPILDIWRGELGMRAPLSDTEFAAIPQCEMLGPDALWLDVTGDYTSMTGKQMPGARLLVAVRSDGATITFAKLIGPADEVGDQVEAFRQFCAALRRNS